MTLFCRDRLFSTFGTGSAFSLSEVIQHVVSRSHALHRPRLFARARKHLREVLPRLCGLRVTCSKLLTSAFNSQLSSEMSQLKRKSLDASPDTNGDNAPSKRLKVEDAHTESEDHGVEGRERARDSPSRSPKERRPYDSRRRDSSSPPRRPERRDSEVSRRESVAVPPKDRNSRNSFSQEDKKRGKRLFGGLLSTLSQTTSNSQQKRRQEVEKRQQERAAKQRVEDDKRRSEKLAKLDKIRKIEQVRFDEQVVRDTRIWTPRVWMWMLTDLNRCVPATPTCVPWHIAYRAKANRNWYVCNIRISAAT